MGRGDKKATDDELIKEYKKTNSVWKTGEKFGMCGQSVHERLLRLGVTKKINVFTSEEMEILKKEYKKFRDLGRLEDLAAQLGRTKQFICRQAKKIGLTSKNNPRPWQEKQGTNPYFKYHRRVRILKGSPHKCEVCGMNDQRKWYDWANLTGDYENPDDYKRMCRKCHREYDKDRPMRMHPGANIETVLS